MAVNRQTDPYGGRFARDASASGVAAGYQQAVQKLDKGLVQRGIAPYKKYGFEQNLTKLSDMTDQQRYDAAASAVIKKFKGTKVSTGGKAPSTGGSKPSPKPAPRPAPKPAPKPKPKGPTAAQKRAAAQRQKAEAAARKARQAAKVAAANAAARAAAKRAAAEAARRKAKQRPPQQKPKPKPPVVAPKPGSGGRSSAA